MKHLCPFLRVALRSPEAITADRHTKEPPYVRTADSGNRATFHFCPECGSTVHYALEVEPELIAIPVGTFADPAFPAPRVSVYESRQHPWTGLPADVEHFD